MKYALIKDNKIQNVIVADEDFLKHIEKNWEHIIAIDDFKPMPWLDWNYENKIFTSPDGKQRLDINPSIWSKFIGWFK